MGGKGKKNKASKHRKKAKQERSSTRKMKTQTSHRETPVSFHATPSPLPLPTAIFMPHGTVAQRVARKLFVCPVEIHQNKEKRRDKCKYEASDGCVASELSECGEFWGGWW